MANDSTIFFFRISDIYPMLSNILPIFPQCTVIFSHLIHFFSWFIVKSVECLILESFLFAIFMLEKTWSKSMEKSQNSVGSIPSGFARPGQYLEHREMDRMTSTVRVFARAKPEDKLDAVAKIFMFFFGGFMWKP